ncbi:cytochrome P450 [Auriculariales sp. MPI-PUGE-AT-0066]|nr:cytochrome P450 [Auriculariales sp. MPI-PUGE-AT-0066]
MPVLQSAPSFMDYIPEIHASHVAVAVATFVTLRLVYNVYLYPRFVSPLRHLPGPPLGGVIAGQVRAMLADECGLPQLEWVKEHGSIVRAVGPLGIERLIFTRPEALQKIMVEDWLENPRPAFMRKVLGIVTGYGLLTVTGNDHRLMRKTMLPAFSIQHLQAQTEVYYEAIDGLVEIMKAELKAAPTPGTAVMPMYDWMSRVTLDIICLAAFGYEADSLHNPDNELAQAYHNLISLQSGWNLAHLIVMVNVPGFSTYVLSSVGWKTRHFWQCLPGFHVLTTLIDCMHRIKRVSRAILDERMEEAKIVGREDVEAKRDIMSLLVRARMATKDEAAFRMNDEQMMDQVLTFLGAGHETTASGLTWTLWLLASHPDAQAKLRKELVGRLAADTRPDYRTLTKDLPYLDAVVHESLRVLPPVPMTFRKTARDTIIDGVRVPAGTLLYIPIRVQNLFRPERWLDGSPTTSGPGMTFILGPHACIGKTMSIVEMKAVLAPLIMNFNFEHAYPGQKMQPTAAVTMKPKDNMPLRVSLVNKTTV